MSSSDDDYPSCEVCGCYEYATERADCCCARLCEEHYDKVMLYCESCDLKICEPCNNVNGELKQCKKCKWWQCEWCAKEDLHQC